jgi:hypothetical protein
MSEFNKEALKVLQYWIVERERIRQRKEAGQPQPWTKDPILATYRFCNVDRNDDRVTREIHAMWLEPYFGQPDLWFAMTVARLLNLPASLWAVEPAVFRKQKPSGRRVVEFTPAMFVEILHDRRADGHKLFNAAYIVSTNGRAMDKVEYLASHVLTPLWGKRAEVRPRAGDTLDSFHKRLMQFDGMGSFMAAQVVGDIKYDEKGHLHKAPDFSTWAASGPGSRRGMNRLLGRPTDAPFREDLWRVSMVLLRERFPNITAQNLQNCLCEFDKYMRVKLGEGTPKQHYKPQEN